MTKKSYSRSKGRREKGPFSMLPHQVMDSPNYRVLSHRAVRLLTDLCRQYNGRNNGDLCASYSVMKQRGWSSKDQLYKALEELTYYGFLLKARQGGRHRCSLFALTYFSVDECAGKHDLQPTNTPPSNWRVEREPYGKKTKSVARTTGHPSPHHGPISRGLVVPLARHTGQSGAKS